MSVMPQPTKEQKQLTYKMGLVLSSWRTTNDISSPTHDGDIGEFVEHEPAAELLGDLLKVLREYDGKDQEAE